MSDYDRENWQAEQSARDEVQNAYRDKMDRARRRSAANAKRKIARLHAKLTELGHISDFEDEFGESVLERLDKYGSAFHDREKGRAGDALSLAQKQVVARMNKKVKELKAKQIAGENLQHDPDAGYVRTADRWKDTQDDKRPRRQNGFKSKGQTRFQPRIRQIEDEIEIEERVAVKVESPIKPEPPRLAHSNPSPRAERRPEPYIPEYVPPNPSNTRPSTSPGAKRPFLRVVPKA